MLTGRDDSVSQIDSDETRVSFFVMNTFMSSAQCTWPYARGRQPEPASTGSGAAGE